MIYDKPPILYQGQEQIVLKTYFYVYRWIAVELSKHVSRRMCAFILFEQDSLLTSPVLHIPVTTSNAPKSSVPVSSDPSYEPNTSLDEATALITYHYPPAAPSSSIAPTIMQPIPPSSIRTTASAPLPQTPPSPQRMAELPNVRKTPYSPGFTKTELQVFNYKP